MVSGNDVPGAVGQSDPTLLLRFQDAWVNAAGEIRQGFGLQQGIYSWLCDLALLHRPHSLSG